MDQQTKTPCGLCLAIIRSITVVGPPHKLEWHQDVQQLQDSAESCPLCSGMWEMSVSQDYSSAVSRLAGAPMVSSPQLTLEVQNVKQAEGISWAVLRTGMEVQQLSMTYQCIDTIGISSRPQNESSRHPKFWRFGKTDQSKTFSEDRITTLKKWLRECESDHQICQPVTKRCPKRILSVKIDEPIRIVATNQIHQDEHPIQYATLSHSWGNHIPIRTTIETQALYQDCIPQTLLPRTFRDAINITQSLGINYLWIDSLCIVQDDPKDWQEEAFHMKDTYSGSTINIAADMALNSTIGCFPEDNDIMSPVSDSSHEVVLDHTALAVTSHRVFVHEYNDELRSIMIRFQVRTPRQLQSRAHLGSRGWVLQEELLSHRIVHCMERELYWQCKCSYKTQAGQAFEPSEIFRNELDMKLGPSQRKDRIWYEWIEDYSTRDLTVPGDRMAAMAGIASYYQQMTGYSPLLGLWQESFAGDLLWVRIGSTRSSGVPGVPSWTWLSCDAPICFDFWRRSVIGLLEVIDNRLLLTTCDINWTGLATTSSVQSTRLIIRAPIKELRFQIAPGPRFNPEYLNLEGEELDSSMPIPWTCSGQFDDDTIQREGFETYTCVLVRSSLRKRSEFPMDTFLILEPVKSPLGEPMRGFRRIGIGSSWDKQSIFLSAVEKEIRLY